MYSIADLKEQNKEISQLCDVLSVLMEQESLHENPFVLELMKRFKEKVWVHLVFEDNTIYAAMLHSNNEEVSNIAQTFHESAKEIKHHFSDFVRQGRVMPKTSSEHDTLSKETRNIFELIRKRIDYENQKVFPLVEKNHS